MSLLPFRALSQPLHLGPVLLDKGSSPAWLPLAAQNSNQTAKTRVSLPTSTFPVGAKPSLQGKGSSPLGAKYPRVSQQIRGLRQAFWELLGGRGEESFHGVDSDSIVGRNRAESHISVWTPAHACLGHQGSELGTSLREVRLPLACAGHLLSAVFFPMGTAALLRRALWQHLLTPRGESTMRT